MTKYTLSSMRPELVVCPNFACEATARIGVHFCHGHATLAGTPGMVADLMDHIWSIDELNTVSVST